MKHHSFGFRSCGYRLVVGHLVLLSTPLRSFRSRLHCLGSMLALPGSCAHWRRHGKQPTKLVNMTERQIRTRISIQRYLSLIAFLAISCEGFAQAVTSAPILFTNAAFEAPVHVDQGELLQLPGANFTLATTVYYSLITDLSAPLPNQPPIINNLSRFNVVSTNNIPNSIVVQAPNSISENSIYAIWAANAFGWSAPLLINDPRPQWLSPSELFATATLPSLGRDFRVIGRNLRSRVSGPTLVQLLGPQTFSLSAAVNAGTIDKYVAHVTLPTGMPTGSYNVSVSTDGGLNWVAVSDNGFTIIPDPQNKTPYDITTYGAIANDGRDDTAAINAAANDAAAHGGFVYIPAGQFDIAGYVNLPQNVDLIGAGSTVSVLNDIKPLGLGGIMVSLHGSQTIMGIHFIDPLSLQRITIGENSFALLLNLFPWWPNYQPQSGTLQDITVVNNNFDGHTFSIFAGDIDPLQRLTIVNNTFQAPNAAIYLNQIGSQLALTDSVIRYNNFLPSPVAGVMPSNFSGVRHLDESQNTLQAEPAGWGHGFFLELNGLLGSNEDVLLSENSIQNTGDSGDGESFASDGAGDTVSFIGGPCSGAGANTITLPANWQTANTNVGQWVQITDGRGVGQSRKIATHTAGAQDVITLSAAWDVTPDCSAGSTTQSSAVVHNLHKNIYVVDGLTDNRVTGFSSPINLMAGGVITFYGSTVDSSIEGNQLYDTGGIFLNGTNTTGGAMASNGGLSAFNYFNEVANNVISGKANTLGPGGIFLYYASNPGEASAGVEGYGARISANIIETASLGGSPTSGGAISILPGWYSPATPYAWKEVLAFDNIISNVSQGIFLANNYIWDTVLLDNDFSSVATPIVNNGVDTVNLQSQDQPIWGLSSSGQPYQYNSSGVFVGVGGVLSQISVGADGAVWGINSSGMVYQYNGSGGWYNVTQGLPTSGLSNISVGNANSVWGLTSSGLIYQYVSAIGFTQVGGVLTQISVGADGSVWGINSSGMVFQYNGAGGWQLISEGLPSGTTLSTISVGNASSIWGLTASGQIYQYNDINGFSLVGGVLTQISVGADGSVWGINSSGMVFQYNGLGSWFNVTQGVPTSGLSKIFDRNANSVWGLASSGQVYQFDGAIGFSLVSGSLSLESLNSMSLPSSN